MRFAPALRGPRYRPALQGEFRVCHKKGGISRRRSLKQRTSADKIYHAPAPVLPPSECAEPALHGMNAPVSSFSPPVWYIVYSHIAPSLQCDESLTLEVIESEPGLIEGTPLAADKNFIEKYMNRYPEITKYMDETLQVYPSIQRAINPEGYEIKKQTAISTRQRRRAVVRPSADA